MLLRLLIKLIAGMQLLKRPPQTRTAHTAFFYYYFHPWIGYSCLCHSLFSPDFTSRNTEFSERVSSVLSCIDKEHSLFYFFILFLSTWSVFPEYLTLPIWRAVPRVLKYINIHVHITINTHMV